MNLGTVIGISLKGVRPLNLAHKATSRELDSAQEMTKLEMEKVAKLQSEKRQMLTIREELSLEQEAKRDLETERDMIKDRVLGSQFSRNKRKKFPL